MKQKMIIAAIIAIAMVGCTEEETPNNPTGKTVTVTAGIKQQAETRIGFDVGTNETEVLWKTNDKFGIHWEGATSTAYKFELDPADADKTSGAFANTTLASVDIPNKPIYAIYYNNTAYSSNRQILEANFSSQNGTGIDKHIMAATATGTEPGTKNWDKLNFNFEHKTAVLQIAFDDPVFANKTISNITITGAGLVTYAKYTIATGLWSEMAYAGSISIDNKAADSNGKFTICIAQPVLDNPKTDNIIVKATVGGIEYTATLGSGSFSEAAMYKAEAKMYNYETTMAFTIVADEINKKFTLPFNGDTGNYTLTVDWGDGSNSEDIPTGVGYGDIRLTKEYNPGTYTITLTSTVGKDDAQMPVWYFNSYPTSKAMLKSMDTPMLNMKTTGFYCFFASCTTLETIHPSLFAKHADATTFECCFLYCTALKEIPNGLFHGLADAMNFKNCFQNCTSAKLNPNIFCNENTEMGTHFANKDIFFNLCFYYVGNDLQPNQGGTAPRLWNYTYGGNIETYKCFMGCISVDNYKDIPHYW